MLPLFLPWRFAQDQTIDQDGHPAFEVAADFGVEIGRSIGRRLLPRNSSISNEYLLCILFDDLPWAYKCSPLGADHQALDDW